MQTFLLLGLVAAAGLGCVQGIRFVVDENVGPEQKLDPTSCQFGSKYCHANSCLRDIYWCDGRSDCHDESDEKNCTECGPDAFMCDNVCTSNIMKCDGTKDCKDGSDEAGCGPILESQLFRCDDNTTRRLEAKCDGWPECADQSDEKYCKKHMCQPGHIYCLHETKGECLPTSYICDGLLYCDDGADEKNCSFDVEFVTIPKTA